MREREEGKTEALKLLRLRDAKLSIKLNGGEISFSTLAKRPDFVQKFILFNPI